MKKLWFGLILTIAWILWYFITAIVCLEFIFTTFNQLFFQYVLATFYSIGTVINMFSNLKSILRDD